MLHTYWIAPIVLWTIVVWWTGRLCALVVASLRVRRFHPRIALGAGVGLGVLALGFAAGPVRSLAMPEHLATLPLRALLSAEEQPGHYCGFFGRVERLRVRMDSDELLEYAAANDLECEHIEEAWVPLDCEERCLPAHVVSCASRYRPHLDSVPTILRATQRGPLVEIERGACGYPD